MLHPSRMWPLGPSKRLILLSPLARGGVVQEPKQKTTNLLSEACRSAMAPLAALTLGALSAPAQIILVPPTECLRIAETDPIAALATLDSHLADRSDLQLFESTRAVLTAKADALMDLHVCELATALRDDSDGTLIELLGQGLSRWVEIRELDRILDAGGEPWTLGEYDPFMVMLEKFPDVKIYPLLEERIRDLLNASPPLDRASEMHTDVNTKKEGVAGGA